MSSPELWLDSNIVRSPAKVQELVRHAKRKGIAVLAHAQVHLEVCRQARQRAHDKGEPYEPHVVDEYLTRLGITIAEAALDRSTAETWARQLQERFPAEVLWKKAKLSAVRASLPDDATVSARRVPFTTDWLIALEVERREVFIAVEDQGEEWRALREASPKRALSYEEALAWLASHDDAGALPP